MSEDLNKKVKDILSKYSAQAMEEVYALGVQPENISYVFSALMYTEKDEEQAYEDGVCLTSLSSANDAAILIDFIEKSMHEVLQTIVVEDEIDKIANDEDVSDEDQSNIDYWINKAKEN